MKAVLSSYTLSLAGLHSDQRLDGGSIRNAPGVRGGDRSLYVRVVSSAAISSNIHVCWLLAAFCKLRRRHDGPRGASDDRKGRSPKSELIRAMSFVAIPGLVGPMLGPIAARSDRRVLSLETHLFRGTFRSAIIGLCMVYLHLPDYREKSNPLDTVGLILFGGGIALLSYCAGGFRRAYTETCGRSWGSGDFDPAAGGAMDCMRRIRGSPCWR